MNTPKVEDIQKFLNEQLKRRAVLVRRVELLEPLLAETKQEIEGRNMIINRAKAQITSIAGKN